jgi:hypothetical protein
VTKTCTKCGSEKPLSDFCPSKRYRLGVTSWCRVCLNKYERGRRARPGPVRDNYLAKAQERNAGAKEAGYFWERHLLKKYGLTRNDYAAMLEAQGGVCAICARPESDVGRGGEVKPLAVDHCHVTERIRGLHCHGCNTGSNWDTVPDWPAKAQVYLSRFGASQSASEVQ